MSFDEQPPGDDLDEGDFDEEDSLVRAFTLTGGRTRNESIQIAIECLVYQSLPSQQSPPSLGPVETDIWTTAGERLSPAEISAHLELPLGVVRVLVGDLVTGGLLDVGRTTDAGDRQLVRRLIDGVRAL